VAVEELRFTGTQDGPLWKISSTPQGSARLSRPVPATGEVDIELSRPLRDLDLDRFQRVLLHTITKLLVNVIHWVLLEAVAHG
jgi:hypothetical protein